MCEELKPCPSCGNKKVSIIEVERPSIKYAIWCIDCNAHSPYFTSCEDAIKAWNEQQQQERAIMPKSENRVHLNVQKKRSA